MPGGQPETSSLLFCKLGFNLEGFFYGPGINLEEGCICGACRNIRDLYFGDLALM